MSADQIPPNLATTTLAQRSKALGRELLKVVTVVAVGVTIGVAVTQPRLLRLFRQPTEVRFVEGTLPSKALSLAGKFWQGSRDAPVTVIEFGDFECPACAGFHKNTMPALKSQQIDTGAIQLFFWHLPLARHSLAVEAAAVAECAGRGGSFWRAFDLLYDSPRLTAGYVRDVGSRFDNGNGFEECAGETRAYVKSLGNEAAGLGIRATPTFLLGTVNAAGLFVARERITGSHGVDTFVSAIERVKAATKERPARRE